MAIRIESITIKQLREALQVTKAQKKRQVEKYKDNELIRDAIQQEVDALAKAELAITEVK